jgi:lipopolysaccharide transport system permease protein
MNPHAPQPTSMTSLVTSLWRHRQLILQLTRRDVIGRYKGSVMGVMWSLVNPLALLAIYSFVFSTMFNVRWQVGLPETKSQFAMVLFAGMIVHSLFAETLNRAPGLIVGNVSYVKKIVFPLEIFPVVAVGTALFHALVSVLVLAGAFLVINGYLHLTVIFLPLVLLPLMVLALGATWGLASLGVFLRDVAQPIGLVTTALLFASPVFYPITAFPEHIKPWVMLNPLTFIIDQTRAVLIFGQMPNWGGLAIYSSVSAVIGWIGYVWFQKTRKGFADVL